MDNIIESYNGIRVVPFSSIPEYFLKSFKEFMVGQTMMMNEDGVMLAYASDYSIWFNINEKSINRYLKINKIINEKG